MGNLLISFPTIDCPIIISHWLPIFTLSSYQFVEKILLNIMPHLTLETLAYIKVCWVCSEKTYDFYPLCDLLIYFYHVTFLRYVSPLYLFDLQGLNLVYYHHHHLDNLNYNKSNVSMLNSELALLE